MSELTLDECDDLRSKLRNAPAGFTIEDLARTERVEWSPTTVRVHVNGSCDHDNDERPLEYDGSAWVVCESVAACPFCDEADVGMSAATGTREPRGDRPRYRCDRCGRKFDEPKMRDPHRAAPDGAGSSLTAALAKANPDEWP